VRPWKGRLYDAPWRPQQVSKGKRDRETLLRLRASARGNGAFWSKAALSRVYAFLTAAGGTDPGPQQTSFSGSATISVGAGLGPIRAGRKPNLSLKARRLDSWTLVLLRRKSGIPTFFPEVFATAAETEVRSQRQESPEAHFPEVESQIPGHGGFPKPPG